MIFEKEKENLENAKNMVVNFEEKVNIEVRKQKKVNMAEEKDLRKREWLRKYIAEILYR